MAEIKSKNEFNNLVDKLKVDNSDFDDLITNLESYVSGLEIVDGIDPIPLGKNYCTTLRNILNNRKTITNNIYNYINEINELDQYDFDMNASSLTQNGDNSLDNNNGNLSITPQTVNKYEVIKTADVKSETGLSPQSSKANIVRYEGKNNVDISKYKNDKEKGFETTTGNLAYNIPQEDMELLEAIVASQSDGSYDDSLAITSVILNRCENKNWANAYGSDPILQATSKGGFMVYTDGTYKKYQNNIPNPVSNAVKDCLNGVRNNNYLQISPNEMFSTNYISETGNRFK